MSQPESLVVATLLSTWAAVNAVLSSMKRLVGVAARGVFNSDVKGMYAKWDLWLWRRDPSVVFSARCWSVCLQKRLMDSRIVFTFWTMSCYTLGWFFKSFLIWTDISCIFNSIYMTNNLAKVTSFLPVNHKMNIVEKGR